MRAAAGKEKEAARKAKKARGEMKGKAKAKADQPFAGDAMFQAVYGENEKEDGKEGGEGDDRKGGDVGGDGGWDGLARKHGGHWRRRSCRSRYSVQGEAAEARVQRECVPGVEAVCARLLGPRRLLESFSNRARTADRFVVPVGGDCAPPRGQVRRRRLDAHGGPERVQSPGRRLRPGAAHVGSHALPRLHGSPIARQVCGGEDRAVGVRDGQPPGVICEREHLSRITDRNLCDKFGQRAKVDGDYPAARGDAGDYVGEGCVSWICVAVGMRLASRERWKGERECWQIC